MGKVVIQRFTTKEPLEMMGFEAAVCIGASNEDSEKNIKRSLDCIDSEHDRVLEFPDIYMTLEGYSAKVMREFYTHIGGSPTRLQQSTRYGIGSLADYGFKSVIPKTIASNEKALEKFNETMSLIGSAVKEIEDLGIPREDATTMLPLGMETIVVVKMNFRTFVHFCHQRLCSRAYWEIRDMARDIINGLKEYSPQWATLVETKCVPKCEYLGKCPEKRGCGKFQRAE